MHYLQRMGRKRFFYRTFKKIIFKLQVINVIKLLKKVDISFAKKHIFGIGFSYIKPRVQNKNLFF